MSENGVWLSICILLIKMHIINIYSKTNACCTWAGKQSVAEPITKPIVNFSFVHQFRIAKHVLLWQVKYLQFGTINEFDEITSTSSGEEITT